MGADEIRDRQPQEWGRGYAERVIAEGDKTRLTMLTVIWILAVVIGVIVAIVNTSRPGPVIMTVPDDLNRQPVVDRSNGRPN